jgi:hypothetical protein
VGKSDLTDPFENGKSYNGAAGCQFECIKDGKGISFHNLNYPSSQPQGSLFKDPNFVENFEKLLEKLQLKENI